MKLGYVKGVGPRSTDDPGYNLGGGDPYYTDGLRAVLLCTDDPTQFSEIQFFNWDCPPGTKPYIDSFSGSRSKHPPEESEK